MKECLGCVNLVFAVNEGMAGCVNLVFAVDEGMACWVVDSHIYCLTDQCFFFFLDQTEKTHQSVRVIREVVHIWSRDQRGSTHPVTEPKLTTVDRDFLFLITPEQLEKYKLMMMTCSSHFPASTQITLPSFSYWSH